MPDVTPSSLPAEPAPQAPSDSVPGAVVVPPAPPPKKGPWTLWLIILLVMVAVGGGAYVLYTQLQKPTESVTVTPPRLVIEESKPEQGFNARPVTTSAPGASPTITSTDSVSDIEKDLMGTTIEEENATEFDADLQSL